MNNQTIGYFFKAYASTFFVKLPLLTLILMPIFFVMYGGDFHKVEAVAESLLTFTNVSKYFGVLFVSYLGHVIYGWTKVRARVQAK